MQECRHSARRGRRWWQSVTIYFDCTSGQIYLFLEQSSCNCQHNYILVRHLLPGQKSCLSSQPHHVINLSFEALHFLFRPTIPSNVFFQGHTSSFLSLNKMSIFFSVDLASSLTTTDHILLECTLPLVSNFGCSTGSTHSTCPPVVTQFPHQNPGHDLGRLSLP